MTSETTTAGAPKSGSRLYAHYVLFVLLLANVLSIADRSIMGLLLEPIKNDLHASDTSMSLLTGLSFVLFYSLFGIPIARWSDRGNRRGILAAGVAVWSVMTSICGVASNFTLMAIARAGVGIGEATCTPTSISLIADYYSRQMRARMIAIFNMALPLSAILVTPLIGLVADNYGWRMAFIVLGIPGVIVALLVFFTVREPARGASDEAHVAAANAKLEPATLKGAVKAMTASKPFMLILIGTAITGMGSATLGAWGPAIMMRAYHMSATEIGAMYAPLIAISGVLGGIAGPLVISWVVQKRKSERWVILLPAWVSVLTIPAGVIFAFAPNFAWFGFGAFLGVATGAFRTAPYLALSLELVSANYRGMAAAATLIATSVVGQALGPLGVGIISDFFAPTVGPVMALRYGLAFAPITLALGVIPFFMALKYFDKDGLKAEYRP